MTGCTVILCGVEGAVCGVDVRGAAPGTRETDLLDPSDLVERVHAIVLSGGSAFGLDSACGVVRYLEERGIGYETGVARIPIVPAAVIYDLGAGSPSVRPDSAMGYAACRNARVEEVEVGRIGAGTGATIGKILGHGSASPGGIGMASAVIRGGYTVGVLVVVNSFGDVVNPETGQIVAGARAPDGSWLDTATALAKGPGSPLTAIRISGIENTTLAVVATDAVFTKAQARRVASMAHDGFARAIRPAHTMFDGDAIFALSTGTQGVNAGADVTAVGSAAADLLARAIVSATA